MELLDRILSRPNMQRAYQRVMRNKGAAGVDGMSVDTLKSYLQTDWQQTKAALLRGDYCPPVSYTHLTLPTICSV